MPTLEMIQKKVDLQVVNLYDQSENSNKKFFSLLLQQLSGGDYDCSLEWLMFFNLGPQAKHEYWVLCSDQAQWG